MQQRNADLPEDQRIMFRIGINIGDVIVQDGDVFGDGVNIAARLESIARPGGVCVRLCPSLALAYGYRARLKPRNPVPPVITIRSVGLTLSNHTIPSDNSRLST